MNRAVCAWTRTRRTDWQSVLQQIRPRTDYQSVLLQPRPRTDYQSVLQRLLVTALLAGLFCLSIFVSPSTAQDSDVVIRTKAEPEHEVFVGQKINLIVEVLAKDSWASVSQLPQIEIDGAIVYVPNDTSSRLSETIDGDSYTGQRYGWWIYPQRNGTVTISPFEIDVRREWFDVNAKTTIEKRATEQIVLVAKYPNGVTDSTQLIFANRLDISEQWSQTEDEAIKVGDGVTRTIKRTVEGAPAMLLPAMPWNQPEGVRGYVKQAEVNDKSNRGSLTGTRTDAITYVFESSGSFTLPELSFAWWNEDSDRAETITLPPRTIDVVDATDEPAISASGNLTNTRPSLKQAVAVSLAILLLVGLSFAFRVRIQQGFKRAMSSSFVQERRTFKNLVATARAKNTTETIKLLYAWMDFPLDDVGAAQVKELIHRYGNQNEPEQITQLFGRIGETDIGWTPESFVPYMKSVRRNWLSSRHLTRKRLARVIPKLNP